MGIGIVSVHGPGLASLGADEESADDFSWDALRSLLCEGNDCTEPLSIPVLWGLPIGHGRRNVAFRHGVTATLDPELGISVCDYSLRSA